MKCHKCGSKDHLQDKCDQATHFAFGGYTLLQTTTNVNSSDSEHWDFQGPPPLVNSSSSDENAPQGPSSSDKNFCPNPSLNEQLRTRERELYAELFPLPTEQTRD